MALGSYIYFYFSVCLNFYSNEASLKVILLNPYFLIWHMNIFCMFLYYMLYLNAAGFYYQQLNFSPPSPTHSVTTYSISCCPFCSIFLPHLYCFPGLGYRRLPCWVVNRALLFNFAVGFGAEAVCSIIYAWIGIKPSML